MSAKLEVSLSVIDQATKELKAVGKEFDNLQNQIVGFGKAAIGIFAGGAIVTGVRGWIKSSEEYGNAVQRMSQRLGMSAESAQKLDYVITVSGGHMESMQKPMINMAKLAFDNDAAFKALGISVKDSHGNLKEAGALFEETMIKVAGIGNATERAAIAQKLFGKGTADLLPLLSQGQEHLRGLYDETEKYHTYLSDHGIKSLADTAEQMRKFDYVTKAASASLATNLMPVIMKLVPALMELSAEWGYIFNRDDQEKQNKALEDKGTQIRKLGQEIASLQNLVKSGMATKDTPIADAATGKEMTIAARIKADLKARKEIVDGLKKTATPPTFGEDDFKADAKTKKAAEDEGLGIGLAIQGGIATAWKSKDITEIMFGGPGTESKANAALISQRMMKQGQEFLAGLSPAETDAQMEAAHKKYLDFEEEMSGRHDRLMNESTQQQIENLRTLEVKNQQYYDAARISEEEYVRNKTELFDKELALQQKQVDAAMSMGEAFGNAVGTGFQKGQFKVHDALKSLLNLLVDALEKQALAAVASNTLQNITDEGWIWGSIIGGAEAAGIEIVAALAKSSISSFAVGTSYAPGGMAMVGERGPELMHVPQGSQIYTHDQTSNILNNNHQFHITLVSSGGVAENLHSEIRAGDPGVQKLISVLNQKIGS